jgi:transcriptional regulator GlxA family with amidase domain
MGCIGKTDGDTMIAKKIAYYLLVFLAFPIVFGLVRTFSSVSDVMIVEETKPLETETELLIKRPETSRSKRLSAVILASQAGTQVTDLLGSYEVLGQSGEFNTQIAGVSLKLSPITGKLGFIPHVTLDQVKQGDLLVLPAVMDPANRELVKWVRTHANQFRQILVLGEGARIAFAAGLLENRTATTHFAALQDLRQNAPSVRWSHGPRYIEDGPVLSSAGGVAGIDATLRAIENLAGPRVAQETAERLSYLWRKQENPSEGKEFVGTSAEATPRITLSDLFRLFLLGGYDWNKRSVGVLLYPGISELALAAYLDTLPRTLSNRVFTLAPERQVIESRNGMKLVPMVDFKATIDPDFLVVPGGLSPEESSSTLNPLLEEKTRDWIRARNITVKNYLLDAPAQSFEQTLDLIQKIGSPTSPFDPGLQGLTGFVAKMIEYPVENRKFLPQKSENTSFPIWIRPFFIGLAGLMVGALFEARFIAPLSKSRSKVG